MIGRRRSSSGSRMQAALVLSILLTALAGCVGAQSTSSPAASTTSKPPASAKPLSTFNAASTWTLSASATDMTPKPTPQPIDLAHLAAAPAGTWTNIRWIGVPDIRPWAVPTLPDAAETPQNYFTTSSIKGWSRGYVAFSVLVEQQTWTSPVHVTVATTHSADGANWQPGSSWTQTISNPALDIRQVYEGPSGLLAVGESGGCGDSWVEALWTSPDGAKWTSVDMKKAFRGTGIESISGGSTGFVATAESGHGVWTSRDGQTWRAVDLNAAVFKASRVDGGTAFSDGFVLAGSTELLGKHGCGTVADPSASATPPPPLRAPAVWWSADGTRWEKQTLPGAATAYSVGAGVYRLNDRALLASMYLWGPGDGLQQWWRSGDGRSWTPVDGNALQPEAFLTDGRHTLQVVVSSETQASGSPSGAIISAVRDDGTLVTLTESGEGPLTWIPGGGYAVQFAVGPTGIVAMGDQAFWVGVPD